MKTKKATRLSDGASSVVAPFYVPATGTSPQQPERRRPYGAIERERNRERERESPVDVMMRSVHDRVLGWKNHSMETESDRSSSQQPVRAVGLYLLSTHRYWREIMTSPFWLRTIIIEIMVAAETVLTKDSRTVPWCGCGLFFLPFSCRDDFCRSGAVCPVCVLVGDSDFWHAPYRCVCVCVCVCVCLLVRFVLGGTLPTLCVCLCGSVGFSRNQRGIDNKIFNI